MLELKSVKSSYHQQLRVSASRALTKLPSFVFFLQVASSFYVSSTRFSNGAVPCSFGVPLLGAFRVHKISDLFMFQFCCWGPLSLRPAPAHFAALLAYKMCFKLKNLLAKKFNFWRLFVFFFCLVSWNKIYADTLNADSVRVVGQLRSLSRSWAAALVLAPSGNLAARPGLEYYHKYCAGLSLQSWTFLWAISRVAPAEHFKCQKAA